MLYSKVGEIYGTLLQSLKKEVSVLVLWKQITAINCRDNKMSCPDDIARGPSIHSYSGFCDCN